MASALASRTALVGKTVSVKASSSKASRAPLCVRAEAVDRRAAVGLVAGAAAVVAAPKEAVAAYGDSANVFGRATNKSGFVPYAGDGFAILLPSKWNPSKQIEFPGSVLRYEDNFDAVNNLAVLIQDTDKKSVTDFGSPENFLGTLTYLLGRQTFNGETKSEGGFKDNRVSAASLLEVSDYTDKKGKPYYRYEILTRTADGDEGGRHQVIVGTVGSDGKLYLLKVQCGDKRWFKGVKAEAVGAADSFIVA